MAGLRTEFDFELPKGFIDEHGDLHRVGRMRLATARDEIDPLRDPRVKSNDAYLPMIILSRVVLSIGPFDDITPKTVEDMFVADVAYLQELYSQINFGDVEADAFPLAQAATKEAGIAA